MQGQETLLVIEPPPIPPAELPPIPENIVAVPDIPLPPAGEGVDWLRSRQAELASWREEAHKEIHPWSQQQRDTNTAWVERNDVTGILEKLTSDTKPALIDTLRAHLQAEDFAEIIKPEWEAAWQHPELRAIRYEKVSQVIEAVARADRYPTKLEGRLLEQTFATLGFDKESAGDMYDSWMTHKVRLHKHHDDYKKLIAEGLKEGDIVEDDLQRLLKSVHRHFATMDYLYTKNPEIPKVLHSRDLIRHFGWYDPVELENQYYYPAADEAVLTGWYDWNGALAGATSAIAINTRRYKKSRYYTEAKTITEARNQLINYTKMKNSDGETIGPIKTLIVNVHADSLRLALDNKPEGIITVDAILNGEFVDNSIVARRGNIWVVGCEAGAGGWRMDVLGALVKATGAYVDGTNKEMSSVSLSWRGKPIMRNLKGEDVTVRRKPSFIHRLPRIIPRFRALSR